MKTEFTSMHQLAHEYLKALSYAHEVIAQKDQNGKVTYQGPYPDEITLVDAAKQMGFEFLQASSTKSQILLHGEIKSVELLELFPFNSDRKRMSVVVKDKGVIKMYMKGADSIVKARLAKDNFLNLDSEL